MTAPCHAGPIAWGWLALTVLGVFAVEAAKNASGEIFDWDSGTDAAVTDAERSPFSGGKRVLVDGLMTRRQTAIMAAAFYAIGIAAGLAIVLGREPRVIWLGMIGVGLAYFYHAPPLALAYRGLGELAVALAYGPVIAVGTFLVQRQTVDAAGQTIYNDGGSALIKYLTGYLVEKSLAVDNIFVIAMLFGFFAVPQIYQHRVLFLSLIHI